MIKTTFTILMALTILACSRVVPAPVQLTGKTFPTVKGTSLEQKEVTLPNDYAGKETLLLIGYQQKTQFDIDRWILGLLQAEVPVQIVEVPTIKGMVPQMLQEVINNGMRSGIPQRDWGIVVTVFEDAEKIVAALGNERPQSAYVVLLNKQGEIVWSTNEGYSATQVLAIKNRVAQLNGVGK